jgi:hypothetical protein
MTAMLSIACLLARSLGAGRFAEFGTVKYASALDCARHMFQHEGISGLYKVHQARA